MQKAGKIGHYDAPLDEAGRPTPKFYAFRDVLARYQPTNTPLPGVPAVASLIEVSPFEVTEFAPLSDLLRDPVVSESPLPMEALGQSQGYVLYRTRITEAAAGPLKLGKIQDYALVLVDGKPQGILDRFRAVDTLELKCGKGAQLDLLVENSGRVNFGQGMRGERKGILEGLTLGGRVPAWTNASGAARRHVSGPARLG